MGCKRVKIILSRTLILFILFSFSWLKATDFSVDFFNVGQGNCTAVYFGKNAPMLLVDAGSSASDKDIEIDSDDEVEESSFKKQRLSEIAENINGVIPRRMTSNFPHLNVIISHGDADHCNWMVHLIEYIQQTCSSLRIRILLGGKEEEYVGEKLGGIRSFSHSLRNDTYNKKIYVAEFEGNLSSIPKFECGTTGTCNILAADISTKDRNRHSIVLEVEKNNVSILLTGDAPGRVLDSILGSYRVDPRKKVTIFQATHHGADSEGSNSPSSFEYLRPDFCVISAGSRKDYGHPRQRMILNTLSSPNIQENSIPHFLQYYSDWSFIDIHPKLMEHLTIGRLESDFVIGFTKLGIFSTASQGDIHFEEGCFTFSKPLPMTSMDNRSSLELVHDFLENSSRSNSKVLGFKSPSIKFSTTEEFSGFVYHLIKTQPHLVSCDLSRVDLSDISEIDFVCILDLIITLKSLSELDLPFSLAPDLKSKNAIEGVWRREHNNTKNLRFIIQ